MLNKETVVYGYNIETKKVLLLLKNSVLNETKIENRLLRAMKDIYVVSFRNYEGTNLDLEIKNVDKALELLFPKYKKLEPLRMDFGKGDPI